MSGATVACKSSMVSGLGLNFDDHGLEASATVSWRFCTPNEHLEMLQEVSFALAGVIILAYIVEWFFSHSDDPREPRRVSSAIPIFGHVIGFLRYGFDYYHITR